MSKIEWTDETWNPTTGCSKVSPGCDNCYAIRMAARQTGPAYEGVVADGDWTGLVRCHPDRLDKPLRWRKPRRVFVDSMSDLFHPDVPDEFLTSVFDVMEQAERHTFQVLTKRPQRMPRFLFIRDATPDEVDDGCELGVVPGRWYDTPDSACPSNIWLGTSIESDRYAFRADHLRAAPAAVRFLSLEPLLGPLPSLDLNGMDWVIVGGESGPGARPMHPEWALDLRRRCVDAGIPFFFKQWGAWAPYGPKAWASANDHGYFCGDGEWVGRSGDPASATYLHRGPKGRRELDGRTWDEMPA